MITLSDQRISELAGAAADALETQGHCKHFLRHPSTGSMCALGAIGYAVTGDAMTAKDWFYGDVIGGRGHSLESLETFAVVAQALKDALAGLITPDRYDTMPRDSFNSVARWNNAYERTAGEVIAALRQVQSEYAMRTYAPNMELVDA